MSAPLKSKDVFQFVCSWLLYITGMIVAIAVVATVAALFNNLFTSALLWLATGIVFFGVFNLLLFVGFRTNIFKFISDLKIERRELMKWEAIEASEKSRQASFWRARFKHK